jgi:hypothetical protein
VGLWFMSFEEPNTPIMGELSRCARSLLAQLAVRLVRPDFTLSGAVI